MKTKYLLINKAGTVSCEYLTEPEVVERRAEGITVASMDDVKKAAMAEVLAVHSLMKSVVEAVSKEDEPMGATLDPSGNWFQLADMGCGKTFSVSARDGSARLRVRKIGEEEVLFEKTGITFNALANYIKANQK